MIISTLGIVCFRVHLLFFLCFWWQTRQVQANPKSISEKYDPQDETGSGFPIEPPVETARNGLSHTGVHPRALEPTWTRKPNQEQLRQVPSRTSSSVWVPNGPHLKPQMSCRPQPGAADFSDISGSLAARNAAKSRRNRLDVAEPAQKHALDRKDDPVGIKDPAPVSSSRRNCCFSSQRMHRS